MRDKLNEILTAYGNYCVESVLLVPTDVSNRKINKAQAKEQILHLLDKSLKKARADELERLTKHRDFISWGDGASSDLDKYLANRIEGVL